MSTSQVPQQSPALRTDALPLALLAGSLSAASESLLTYPLEYIKTRAQLAPSAPTPASLVDGKKGGSVVQGPWRTLTATMRSKGAGGLYGGVEAVVAGSAARTCVRFAAFDRISASIRAPDAPLSGGRALVAGMFSGLLEALLVVVPSETLKVRRIALSLPYSVILRGGGVYAGVLPTLLRQSGNGAVRFGTYSSLKNAVQGSTRPGQALPGGVTFAIGAIAGAVTVYATQPLDVLKTRLQARAPRSITRATNDVLSSGTAASKLAAGSAASKRPGTFGLAAQIVREEGVRALWKGATPRLARLIIGGGVGFTVYEQVVSLSGGL